jgi:hypothetical protein
LYGSLGSRVGDIIVIPPAAPGLATFDHSVTGGDGSIAGLTHRMEPFQAVIDGWFIGFHHWIVGELHSTALGIYFAPADAVEVTPMGYRDCLGHAVYQYEVDLSDCCLLCSEEDPRNPGYYPAQPQDFLEEEEYSYWLALQAVVGATWDPPACGHADRILTGHAPVTWGWHTSPDHHDSVAFTGQIYTLSPYPPDCWDNGVWGLPDWQCPEPAEPVDTAFELLTTPPDCPLSDSPIADPRVPDIGSGTRNRYLSFIAGSPPGQSEAMLVTFVALPVPYTAYNGDQWWLDEPFVVTEAAGSSVSEPPPTFWAARLQCDGPFYTDWTQYDVVHVFDAGILPGATYDVQAIDVRCDPANLSNYSTPLRIDTSVCGDITGFGPVGGIWDPPNGVCAFVDIAAIVDKYRNMPGALQKARADLISGSVTDPPPNRIVDFMDISYAVDCFAPIPPPSPLPGPQEHCP